MEDLSATDTEDSALSYGVVIDCGSSGSRVFVYFWPPHNGNPHDLLDIKQMRDRSSRPVVKKIKPGRCQPSPLSARRSRDGYGPARRGADWFTPPSPGQASPWRQQPRSEPRRTCALCFSSQQPTSRLRSIRKLRCTSCARQVCGCCPRGEFIGSCPGRARDLLGSLSHKKGEGNNLVLSLLGDLGILGEIWEMAHHLG